MMMMIKYIANDFYDRNTLKICKKSIVSGQELIYLLLIGWLGFMAYQPL